MRTVRHDAITSSSRNYPMRTTIDLELDVLLAAKEIARAEGVSLGKVVSRLVRQALTGGMGCEAWVIY